MIDTGITQHPELTGRVLPGFDFISDPAARQRRQRTRQRSAPIPATARATANAATVPRRVRARWHGTFVSGIIAANTNNGAGIAGIDWNAKILPVRVLGKCGGTFDDITAGVLWAAGVPVAGAPANT